MSGTGRAGATVRIRIYPDEWDREGRCYSEEVSKSGEWAGAKVKRENLLRRVDGTVGIRGWDIWHWCLLMSVPPDSTFYQGGRGWWLLAVKKIPLSFFLTSSLT